jgi:hypothetical protein
LHPATEYWPGRFCEDEDRQIVKTQAELATGLKDDGVGLEYLFIVGLQRLQRGHEQRDRFFADPQAMQETIPEVADGYRGDDVPELVVACMFR